MPSETNSMAWLFTETLRACVSAHCLCVCVCVCVCVYVSKVYWRAYQYRMHVIQRAKMAIT